MFRSSVEWQLKYFLLLEYAGFVYLTNNFNSLKFDQFNLISRFKISLYCTCAERSIAICFVIFLPSLHHQHFHFVKPVAKQIIQSQTEIHCPTPNNSLIFIPIVRSIMSTNCKSEINANFMEAFDNLAAQIRVGRGAHSYVSWGSDGGSMRSVATATSGCVKPGFIAIYFFITCLRLVIRNAHNDYTSLKAMQTHGKYLHPCSGKVWRHFWGCGETKEARLPTIVRHQYVYAPYLNKAETRMEIS